MDVKMARCVPNVLSWRGLFVAILSVSHHASFSFAQNPASSALPSTTSSAPPRIHTVTVGLADHKMQPQVTTANVGDTIEFRFYPANHSIVRAEYEYPCIPYEMTGTNKKGFFSGFRPVDKVLPNPPMFSILINDTLPIYFYCSAPGSCITYAMVGVINPQANNSIERQSQLARDSSYMLQPGEPFPLESPTPSTLPTNLPTSTSSSSSSSSAPATGTPYREESSSKSGLPAGAIAGIVVGAVALVILGALLFFFWGRNKALKDEVDRTQSTIRHHDGNPAAPTNMSQPLPPPISTLYQQYGQQQQPLYPFPGSTTATTIQKYPSASTSPSPPPPPHPASNPHFSHQSLDPTMNPMMGFVSPNSPTSNNNNHHARTNTLDSARPWSNTPSYAHLADGAAPAYEEDAHRGDGAQMRQSMGPVEMDGEGGRRVVRGGEEQPKAGGPFVG